jgi:hypothetical protein
MSGKVEGIERTLCKMSDSLEILTQNSLKIQSLEALTDKHEERLDDMESTLTGYKGLSPEQILMNRYMLKGIYATCGMTGAYFVTKALQSLFSN